MLAGKIGSSWMAAFAVVGCAGGNPCALTTANVTLGAQKPADDRVTYFVGGDPRGNDVRSRNDEEDDEGTVFPDLRCADVGALRTSGFR